MKTKQIFAALTGLAILLVASPGHALDIVATNSGNWADATIWDSGTVPGVNDDADIGAGITVTVNTNVSVQYIYDSGTVIMAPGWTLTVVGDSAGAKGTQTLGFLNATAVSNTVIYSGNAFWAKRTDYYNLVFTNSTTNSYDFYNGPIPGYGAAPMTIGGDMTMTGKIKVQQGADITIGGKLFIGTNSSWDASSFNLRVSGDTTVGGLLLDLNGALGSNYFGGNVTVASTAIGWNVSDVIQWGIGGSLTNNGTIVGKGYGSITFAGTGVIAGSKTIKIPTITISGAYTIADTITLTTNTPTLTGTIVFDLARTNQIGLLASVGTLYYSGALQVINSGPAPSSGASFKLFNAQSYDGTFTSTTFPSLPSGLSWVDNTLTTGSIAVTGSAGSPVLTLFRNGGLLTLSWDSATFPGYRVQAQTNSLGGNWGGTGSGTGGSFNIAIDPTNKAVFFRLSNP
ncbi:MAG: hypothetical protein QOJ40_2898 [Verrucomicrobiota bacterium]